ncbi:hypothetical protein IJ531_05225 [bacterium]|nr:hypothetical protein [bacterium]
MKRLCIVLTALFLLNCTALSKTQKEEYQNDYLYSAEYFDYLIECAENDAQKMREEKRQKQDEITLDDDEIDITNDDYTPFRLRIEENSNITPYKDTFKKENSKTIIPIGDKFSIVQDMSKTRNKYNSNDYKILAGGEYQPCKFLTLSSRLETNFRGLDQNPTSRKLYFNPSIKLGDKLNIGFYNKMNILNYSQDHDLGLNVSPFKSKVMDFGVYTGMTRTKDGSISESVNFSTNFYF